MLRAISEFPTRKNLTDVRSWFGLVNQVAYAFSMTDKMLPFRELLKPITTFCNDGWQVVLVMLVGGRFTHPAESRYAPIEVEALAVADALDKSRHFLLGCENLAVAVDFKPLLGLFTNRFLDDIPNNRLRNLKERTLRYKFTMYHVPGLKNCAPDTFSRYPTGTGETSLNQLILPDDIASIASTTNALQSMRSITWDRVRLSTTSDPDMKLLVDTRVRYSTKKGRSSNRSPTIS